MRTSAPGSEPVRGAQGLLTGPLSRSGRVSSLLRRRRAFTLPRQARGFTLIELIVVVALIAIASGVISLAIRDPAAARLENEAARLAALLESARAEARASGVAARWEPLDDQPDGAGFRFVGLFPSEPRPSRWLEAGTAAQVIGARAVVLGPEPLIGEQRIVLRLDDRRLTLATDGIGPFVVSDSDQTPP